MKNLKKRFWEVDFLRGIAIVLMITYHAIYDLNFFGVYSFNLGTGALHYLARAIAGLFILLVGVSLTLSFSRTGKAPWIKYLKRGLKIFSWGLIITGITWIFVEEQFVVFGILHFIGISIILAYPFLKQKFLNLGLGIALIGLGLYLKQMVFGFSWLVWLGIRPSKVLSVDYFPILPWFGVVLIGIFLGNLVYSGYTRQFNLPDLSKIKIVKWFCWLGKHSLLIYLIHQPVLIGLIYLLL